MKRYLIALLTSLLTFFYGAAQDTSLLQSLEDSLLWDGAAQRVSGTFKATHIINTPTVEAPGRKGLEFLIMHRFGRINEGAYALFGLDNATIRFGLDYGLTDRLTVGVGRSSFDKTYDGSVKWKLLQQKSKGVPVSVSLYGLVTNTTVRQPDKKFLNAKYRTAYLTQLLIARKFSSVLSLQLSPAWMHFNLVPTRQDKNEVFALGMGGRYKLTKRMSLNAEYNYVPDNQIVSTSIYHSFSMGLDLETGGHVFQLVFSNSQGMIGPYYLAKTTGDWGAGDIYFGFNISRAFTFNK